MKAANAPSIITYQGKLLIGNRVATTTQSMYFILYDSASGGSALYTASGTLVSPQSVSVTPFQGLFSVNLGDSGTNSLGPSIFRDNASVYLEVRIGSDTLSPRKRITAAPYAFNARFLDGVGTNTLSSTTYIPVSDSVGAFQFNTTTIATATISTLTVTNSISVPAGSIGAGALSSTGITAGTYSSSTHIIGYTVDEDGRLTAVTSTLISINANQVTAGTLTTTRGGTGQDSSGWTGLAYVSAGTWSNTGTISVSLGGTGSSSVGVAGSVPYSSGSAYLFTAVGSAGQLLQSSGSGAPTWVSTTSLGYVFLQGATPGSQQTGSFNINGTGVVDTALGVGTSSPIAKFSVQGTANASPIVEIASSTRDSILRITAGGRVGINSTTPFARLSVQGLGNEDVFTVYNTSTNASLLMVAGSGYVGVRSSSPNHPLTVIGDTHIDGRVIAPSSSPSLDNTAVQNFAWDVRKDTPQTSIGGQSFGWIASTLAYRPIAQFTPVEGYSGYRGLTFPLTTAQGWYVGASLHGTYNMGFAGLSSTIHAMSSGVNFATFDGVNSRFGVNTTSPLARLSVQDGAFLVEGTSGATPISGAGTRLLWVPSKAAFRAGTIASTQWDDANIGTGSAAFGQNATVTGTYSFAAGQIVTAGGTAAVALGSSATARGIAGVAIGDSVTVGGDYSLALGRGIEVRGSNSVGVGLNNGSQVVSANNVMAIVGGNVGIGTTTPLSTLTVQGIASSNAVLDITSSTALSMLRITNSGDIGINTTTPGARLHAVGTAEQLRLGYDAFNYVSFTVASDGSLTAATTGPTTTISNRLSVVGNTSLATVVSGTWNGTAVGAQYGGTGQNSSAWTGVAVVNSGTWSQSSTLGVLVGGTGSSTVGNAGSVAYSNSSAYAFTAAGTSGQLLQSAGSGAPTWVNTSSLGLSALPSGTSGQTLRHNGTDWIATSFLYNTGTFVAVNTTTPTSTFTVQGVAGTNDIFDISSSSAVSILRVKNDGRMSINTTTASAALTIQGGTVGHPFEVVSSSAAATNLFRITANGDVGINTSSPIARLSINNGAILALGTTGATPHSGDGTKLMWVPAKGAFRAGIVGSGQTSWNDSNIGSYSAAFGQNTMATHTHAFAVGLTTNAGGYTSVALGASSNATGDYSVAIGRSLNARAENTIALGYNIDVRGTNSIGIGINNVGSIITTPNVMAIMGGNVGIGNINPSSSLHVSYASANTATDTAAFIIDNPSATGQTSLQFRANNVETSRIRSDLNNNLFLATTGTGDFYFANRDRSDRILFTINDFGYVGISTTAPTHALTLPLSATSGIALYNTADQETNYERGVISWSSNVIGLRAASGGSGANRAAEILASDGSGLRTNNFANVQLTGSSGGLVFLNPFSDSVALSIYGKLTTQTAQPAISLSNSPSANTFTGSSGAQTLVSVNAPINQSGSAKYDALKVEMTENTLGTGTSTLLRLTIVSSTIGGERFVVSRTGTTTISGAIWGPTSTAANPTYAFQGNTDTGMYLVGDDQLGWATGGSLRMTINSNGNVGVNSSTPQARLAVQGTANATPLLDIASSTGKSHLRVLANGNVGVSTTVPNGTLTVAGSFLATGATPGSPITDGAGGTLMAWIPTKAAFRAGEIVDTEWDNVRVGSGSVAFGYGNIASGTYSFAMGNDSQAGGNNSVVFGDTSFATGTGAVAFGRSLTVQGNYSFGISLTSTVAYTISASNTMAVMGGTVGIGIRNPTTTLSVSGTIALDLTSPADAQSALCHVNNGATFNQIVYDCNGAVNADYMEMYAADTGLEVGDVVALSNVMVATTQGYSIPKLIKSSSAYQNGVIGVISNKDQAGDFNSIGHNNFTDDQNPLPLALAGRIPVKVTNMNGNIQIGDKLTSSPIPGVAMRATDEGLTIGIAMGEYTSPSVGTVMTFVNLGWNNALYRALTINTSAKTLMVGTTTNPHDLILSGTLSLVNTTTNKFSFATSTLFESMAGNFSGSKAFIVNAVNFDTTASDRYVFSLRSNNTPVFSVAANGDVHARGDYYGASAILGTSTNPGDLAERVDIAIDDTVEPGDVMIVDENAPDTYRRSTKAYEQSVAGVISTNPTIIVGNGKTDYTAVMAMVGRVPIKVTNENGPIKRGDLLISASRTGYAIKYDASKDQHNKMVAVIGVALEPSDSVSGKILALIRTGWIYNRDHTIASLQTSIETLASAQGLMLSPQSSPDNLTVQPVGDQLIYNGNDWDLHNNSLVRVATILGKNNKWKIDEEGRLIQMVETAVGRKDLYGVQSGTNEDIVLFGSDQLIAGEKRVYLTDLDRAIIDQSVALKILVTPSSPDTKGVVVVERNYESFLVREVDGARSNATFDWMVAAKRKIEGLMPDTPVVPDAPSGSGESSDVTIAGDGTASSTPVDASTGATSTTPVSAESGNASTTADTSTTNQSETVSQPPEQSQPPATDQTTTPDITAEPVSSGESSVSSSS